MSKYNTILRLLYTITPFLIPLAHAERREEKLWDEFITRPDIKAPRWNFTIYDEDKVTPGYWFAAPYQNIGNQAEPGENWLGAHIWNGKGELVWSGTKLWNNFAVQDFRVARVKGKDMLQAILFDEGYIYILGNDYKVADKYYWGDRDVDTNMHELNFIDDGEHVLILTKKFSNSTLEMAKEVNEDRECSVKWDGFKELTAGDWKPVFEWDSYGKIGLNESTFQNIGDKCGKDWDYLHANAVDKCPDGDYVLSARHADSIYKISHVDGSVVWKLSGRDDHISDFENVGSFNFSRQHGVRCREQNATHTVITILDNAKAEDDKPTNDHSRAMRIALSDKAEHKTAHLELSIDHPDWGYAYRRGNYQIMQPSGHSLVCWSEHAHFSEHTPDGRMLMQARFLPQIVGTYRGYKFPWVGLPSDPPDVHAEGKNVHDDDPDRTRTKTTVHVSWNGATEVTSWRLFKTSRDGGNEILIADGEKTGFETAFTYQGFAAYVFAEAIDKDGHFLARSNVFKTLMPEDILTADVANEVLWLQKVTGVKPDSPKPVQKISNHRPAAAAAADEEGLAVLEAPFAGFIMGFIASIGLTATIWFFRQGHGRKSWRWRLHYRTLLGRKQESEGSRPEKESLCHVGD